MVKDRTPQRWFLSHEDREHLIEIGDTGWRRSITWTVDGTPVATVSSMEEKVRLVPDQQAHPGVGAVALRFPTFTGPARRVSWFGGTKTMDAGAQARLGTGGVDFDPEPGSAAATREDWIRAHPRRYQARQTVLAVLGVLLPLVLVGLLGRVVIDIPWPDIDWPDLPAIPWPDIDWPDLPAIPWPDITWPSIQWPDWQLPAWLRWVLDHAKYIVPVVVASVLAKREVGRRRNHDARRTGAPASRQGVDPEQPEHEQDRPEETGPQRP